MVDGEDKEENKIELNELKPETQSIELEIKIIEEKNDNKPEDKTPSLISLDLSYITCKSKFELTFSAAILAKLDISLLVSIKYDSIVNISIKNILSTCEYIALFKPFISKSPFWIVDTLT